MATLSYLKNRKRWRVRYRATHRESGKVFSGSKVFFEKSRAVNFYAEVETQERLWRSGNILVNESIDQAAEEFFRHCKSHTAKTQVLYRMVITRFLKSLPSTCCRIQQIEPAHIQEYLYGIKDQQFKNRTCNSHLTAIKSFCRHYSHRHNVKNPAEKVKMLIEDPPNSRFITPDELAKLLAVADTLATDRILFLANTGLRASEFSKLTPDCYSRKAITIVGKGRKRRTMPLNKAARKAATKLTPATPNALYLQLSRLAIKAKLKPLGPHSLRHYFATQLLIAGVPIIKVSKLLGHSSVQTTERCYAHILDADLKNVTDILDNS